MIDALVTVIVPVYGTEEYLPVCIESIAGQTYKNLQIILVDDGSADRCGAICDRYGAVDGRIEVIHKPNGGVSSARNAGLDAARGKYIYFVDSDDIAGASLLEASVNRMESGNFDMCCWGFTKLDGGKERYFYPLAAGRSFRFCSDDERLRFLCGVFLRGKIRWEAWSRVYRRDIIEKYDLRFSEDIRIGEDLDFTFRYLLHSKSAYCMAERLYTYRVHGNSAMGVKTRREQISDTLCIAHEHCRQARYIPYEKSFICGGLAALAMPADPVREKPPVDELDGIKKLIVQFNEWDFFKSQAEKAVGDRKSIEKAYGKLYGTMVYAFYRYMLDGDKKRYLSQTRIYYIFRMAYIYARNIGRKILSRRIRRGE